MEFKDEDELAPQEVLEDLLIYDDLFLDYFNAFLSLPAFPQVLQYHRLTGTFQIVDDAENSLVEYSSAEPRYGATDEEREKLMRWAQEERLPLFLKTELFREYKLCKLLVRLIDNRQRSTRASTHVRGYSRHSSDDESLTDTDDATDASSSEGEDFTTTGDVPDADDEDEDHEQEREEGGTMQDVSEFDSSETGDRPATHSNSLPTRKSTQHSSSKASAAAAKAAAAKNRSRSAPLNYEEFLRLPRPELVDSAGRRPLVSFSARANDPEFSDVDIRSVEARQSVGFDRLKELILGSRTGMQEFIQFLQPTAGQHLVNFWLDCEFYRDTADRRSSADNAKTRSSLLRDLQDRYRLRLTEQAKSRIRQAANDPEQAHSVFLQTQYDVLRRLRSYWLPRFVIHRERELSGQSFQDLQHAWLNDLQRQQQRRSSNMSGIFPSLSLVSRLPVRPEVARNLADTQSWSNVRVGGRGYDERIKSARQQQQQPTAKTNGSGSGGQRQLQPRLRNAMTVDRIAGGPFQQFLERRGEFELLSCLNFFQEVEEYTKLDEKRCDRFMRLNNAWSIFNRHLNVDCPQSINAQQQEVQRVLESLRKSRDQVPASVFSQLQTQVMLASTDVWLRYLKEDVQRFMESSVSHRDPKSPPKAEEMQVVIENGRIVVRRMLTDKSRSTTVRGRRSSWDFLTKEEKQQRRQEAAERRRIMELERRKAMKAAKKRLRLQQQEGAAKKKNLTKIDEDESLMLDQDSADESTFASNDPNEAADTKGHSKKQKERDQEEEEAEEEKPPELKQMTKNRAVMALYKKYLMDKQGRDAVNALSLYQEIIDYQQLPAGEKGKKKRDANAMFMHKTFLDTASKRRVAITNDRLQQRLQADKERPKSPNLKDLATHLHQRLNPLFNEFWKFQSEEMGVDMTSLKNMSEKELRMRADLETGGMKAGRKNNNKRATGKAQPTKEDKVDFLIALEQNLTGSLSLQMLYFYRYLMQCALQEKLPNLDKNLFFYVEAQKFKEFAQGGCDDEFLKRKIQVISSIFLDSVFPPSLQITVSNDIHQRTLRNAQKYSHSKFKDEISSTIFDEAQFAAFKEMLPYWAGFMKQWDPQGKEYRPVSHQKRLLQQRMEQIENNNKPKVNFKLPDLPSSHGNANTGGASSLTLSLMEGIKWKDEADRRAKRRDMKMMMTTMTTMSKQQQ